MEDPLKLFTLHGSTAIVTGGAGLLGAQFCRTLAKAGAMVIVADRDKQGAIKLAESMVDENLSAIGIATDVTDPQSVEKMVNAAMGKRGRVDILVNSAALDPKFDPHHRLDDNQETRSGAFEYFPLDVWNAAMNVNLTGAFLCCQAVGRVMLAQSSGVMINIASIYGMVGPDQRLYQRPGESQQYKPVYYSVTKAGILGMTSYLATYYAGKNIRVNALTPGGVYNGHDDQFLQAYTARTILGRMAHKDEMNGALLFLASDASSYMTGANLVVDGGWTAW